MKNPLKENLIRWWSKHVAQWKRMMDKMTENDFMKFCLLWLTKDNFLHQSCLSLVFSLKASGYEGSDRPMYCSKALVMEPFLFKIEKFCLAN